MIPLGRIRTLALLAVASAGLLGGHSLTYLGLASSTSDRAGVLEASGHGYLEKAIVFSGAMALMSVLFWLAAGALKRGLPLPRWQATALALGAIQVTGFAAQEVLERLIVGAPLHDLAAVLLLGVPLQLMVAAVGALMITVLHKAGERIAGWLSPHHPTRAGSPAQLPPSSVHFRSALLAGGLGSRGPPPLLSR